MSLFDRVSKKLDGVARDLRVLGSTFSGKRLPVVVARTPRPRAPSAIALATRRVRIVGKVFETANAATLTFEDASGGRLEFAPGQFFTFILPIAEGGVRRAYSACAPASPDGRLSITVKRVEGGRGSAYFVDTAREGDSLSLLGPSGSFTVPTLLAPQARVILIAAGSGITPVMAILRSLLASANGPDVVLIYANERQEDVIFDRAVRALASAFQGRFTLRQVLNSPPESWAGSVGQLGASVLAAELAAAKTSLEDEYFICGPAPVLDAATLVLRERGVARSRVHIERFLSPVASHTPRAGETEGVTVRVRGKGGERALFCPPGKTILEAALAAGESLPYSCSLGGCGACAVTVVEGDIEMDEPNCLLPEERAARRALTCIGRPCGAVTIEVAS